MSQDKKISKLVECLQRPETADAKNDFQFREQIMNELVRIGKEAVPHIIPLLKDMDPAVREHTARALGYIGDASALPFLVEAVEDVYVRGASIRAMEGLGEEAFPVLIELATRHDESISIPAMSVLCMQGERALPVLRNILMDSDSEPRLREAAGHAISVIRMDRRCPFGGNRTMGKDCTFCNRKHK